MRPVALGHDKGGRKLKVLGWFGKSLQDVNPLGREGGFDGFNCRESRYAGCEGVLYDIPALLSRHVTVLGPGDGGREQ